ncbi:hypothetical protein [Sphingomicrobium aestuariivivum]|uniref:hypothetical protein n=1 Tax=Sphingomicrobium aestuariivivum TaxID=1582356 RepID=UPI001FD6E417|nr:hypothetical protein [Sphingomicrobium aestuariivivum]MCJ8191944.1 hypothetical protein [Sphingomicrobium aestuariivivum]
MSELPTEPITLEARTLSTHPRWQLPLALAAVPIAGWLAGLFGQPPVTGLILWGLLALPVTVMVAIALILRPSNRRLGLRIHAEGFFYPAYKDSEFSWNEVEDVKVLGAGDGEAVLFALHDPPHGGGSRAVGVSRIFGWGNFGIRTDDLDCTVDEVAAAAERNFRLAKRAGRFKRREVSRDAEGRRHTVGFGTGRGLRL